MPGGMVRRIRARSLATGASRLMQAGLATTMRLLAGRKYLPLFLTQFGGALNDNVLRNAIIAMITFGALSAHFDPGERTLMVQLALGLFMLPFFLFSATAGILADRCVNMSVVVRWLKALEIVASILASFGLLYDSVTLLMAALFLTGVQSAFFGPFKYAMLPTLLDREELVGGNALLSSSTYVAILLGVVWGTQLGATTGAANSAIAVLVAVACCGFAAACFMRPVRGGDSAKTGAGPGWNIARETLNVLRGTGEIPLMLRLISLISWFWLSGALVVTELPVLVRESLGGNENSYLVMLLVVCLGVATGSMFAAAVLRKGVTTRFVPAGMSAAGGLLLIPVWPQGAGLADGSVLLGPDELFILTEPRALYAAVVVFVISAAMGFYIVPLYAALQLHAPEARRARAIAANNILNALFIVAGFFVAIAVISMADMPARGISNLFIMLGVAGVAAAWAARGTLARIDAMIISRSARR